VPTIEQQRAAISELESGGDYGLLGSTTRNGDRAYGKYQVMGNNVGPWTKEILGQQMTPAEFRANPQAQDKVFDAKFGSYVQQYGQEGAARAWNGGPGAVNSPGNSVQNYGQKYMSSLSPSGAIFDGAPPRPPADIPPVTAVGGGPPAAFIMHHTGGGGDVAGVQGTLHQRGLGVQYVMDREGNITRTGGPGAANIKNGWGPKGEGLTNKNVVGMEVIANNDKDVNPKQIAAANAFIAKNYPNTPVFGHGEVNPGHKEANEGMSIVNSIRDQRAQNPGALSAQTVAGTAPPAADLTQQKGGWALPPAPGTGIGPAAYNSAPSAPPFMPQADQPPAFNPGGHPLSAPGVGLNTWFPTGGVPLPQGDPRSAPPPAPPMQTAMQPQAPLPLSSQYSTDAQSGTGGATDYSKAITQPPLTQALNGALGAPGAPAPDPTSLTGATPNSAYAPQPHVDTPPYEGMLGNTNDAQFRQPEPPNPGVPAPYAAGGPPGFAALAGDYLGAQGILAGGKIGASTIPALLGKYGSSALNLGSKALGAPAQGFALGMSPTPANAGEIPQYLPNGSGGYTPNPASTATLGGPSASGPIPSAPPMAQAMNPLPQMTQQASMPPALSMSPMQKAMGPGGMPSPTPVSAPPPQAAPPPEIPHANMNTAMQGAGGGGMGGMGGKSGILSALFGGGANAANGGGQGGMFGAGDQTSGNSMGGGAMSGMFGGGGMQDPGGFGSGTPGDMYGGPGMFGGGAGF
jgi:hypothetical protein